MNKTIDEVIYMKIGFYAGSFDPFTNGHLHVIENAAILFDKVIVGIGINPDKNRRFDKEIMKNAMEKVFERKKLHNVDVIIYDKLSVDEALEHNSTFLVRGIRNGMDYDYEENLAQVNFELGGLDTVYLRAGDYGMVSSSMVYELIKREKDASKYLPIEILKLVKGE